MGNIAIRAEGLSKRFYVGEDGGKPRQKKLSDLVTGFITSPVRRVRETLQLLGFMESPDEHMIWAIKDVGFEIKKGELVGILGRNGAGKSTLLKILSRITEPTAGYVDVYGTLGALLEVGTGFHPDLSGRENVFLNGAILGMKRAEILRRFDQIVDFAEVHRFIDTPIKHYSTGMRMRLAFSVAAHLDQEILLVDEVLAVGDLEFQKRCLGKMEDLVAGGRTVLFVSHNLAAVKSLCQTSVILDRGGLVFRGSVVDGIAHYLERFGAPDESDSTDSVVTRWSNVTVNGQPVTGPITVSPNASFVWEATLQLLRPLLRPQVFLDLKDTLNTVLIYQRHALPVNGSGGLIYRVALEVPPLQLTPGLYSLSYTSSGIGADGQDEKHRMGGSIFINVPGQVGSRRHARAKLAPPVNWKVEPVDAGTEAPAITNNAE
jgi:lipopolysaccharide transport system ATP-binding protein